MNWFPSNFGCGCLSSGSTDAYAHGIQNAEMQKTFVTSSLLYYTCYIGLYVTESHTHSLMSSKVYPRGWRPRAQWVINFGTLEQSWRMSPSLILVYLAPLPLEPMLALEWCPSRHVDFPFYLFSFLSPSFFFLFFPSFCLSLSLPFLLLFCVLLVMGGGGGPPKAPPSYTPGLKLIPQQKTFQKSHDASWLAGWYYGPLNQMHSTFFAKCLMHKWSIWLRFALYSLK